jgi:hypothetical protein
VQGSRARTLPATASGLGDRVVVGVEAPGRDALDAQPASDGIDADGKKGESMFGRYTFHPSPSGRMGWQKRPAFPPAEWVGRSVPHFLKRPAFPPRISSRGRRAIRRIAGWPADPGVAQWPDGVPREETLEAFREAFATLGYVVCEGEELEAGFEKIALFATDQGVPKHAARQLASSRWTSKLGTLEDIEHALQELVGTEYGLVALVMKRPRAPQAEKSAGAGIP